MSVASKIYELLTNLLSFSFCSLFVMIRYLLMSVMCLLHSACYPPSPPHQFCVDYCFQNLSSEDCIFPKGYENNTLGKIWEANKVHYGGFENSQWEGGACAPVTPLPHYSPLWSHGIFLAAHRREYWSRKYPLRAYMRKTALWLKGYISFACFFSFSSAKSTFSIWQSNQALVEAFQNVDYMVLKWKHRIVFII